ncbi:MAG: hypothetical protein VKN72_24080 [Nostocales cyanobacterium 94392]|nr:hypothetical protein [Nostocales cyanobacterium 94392]
MSRSRFTSPRLRYLKARLSVLARPSFLLGAVFLAAMGFVIKEYWTNPDFLKFAQNQTASSPASSNQSSLSEEDRAIAADIDNLSILDYDQKKAEIPTITNLPDSNKLKTQNEEQLTKILELAKKNETANEIKSNTTSESNINNSNNSSTSSQNPFLTQAENLLKFNFGNKETSANPNTNTNNLSPFASGLQTPQSSLSLGINSTNSTNQNGISESALQTAINQSNNQNQENSTVTTSTNTNTFGQSSINNRSTVPTSSGNQQLRQSGTTPLVDTTIFNQPLNNQQPNPYPNFNQSGLNNQIQNPNNNFYNNQQSPNLNNQLPVTNYNQPNPNLNNQLPVTNYNQPNLNHQILNNQNLNNQPQNPYSNFNNNQLPINNYNQPNFNNQVQNPYNNFNNTPITGNRYSPEIQQRVNNIYNRLTNRDNPTVNPNTYNLPINSGNNNFQQPNTQQFNSPYSTQTPVQYPNSGYGY